MNEKFDLNTRLSTLIFLLVALVFGMIHITFVADKTIYNTGELLLNDVVSYATIVIFTAIFVYFMIVYKKSEKLPLASKIMKYSSLVALIFHLAIMLNAMSVEGGIVDYSFVDAIPFATLVSLALTTWNSEVFIHE